MLYFDEERVRALLDWDALIAAMEASLAAFSASQVRQPLRTMLTIDERQRYLGVMPAVAADVMGLKFVTFYPINEGTGIPTHNAAILLFETRSGQALAALDGTLITEMRTAAVSAAVTKYLMPARSSVLALLGTGVQARAHLAAFSRIAQFDEVRVWSRSAEHAQRFAHEHGAIATDAETAVRGADVIVVATMATQPVLHGAWLEPGAHVNAVGAVNPTWRELDDDAMSACLIVDSREAAARESGDVILSKAPMYAEAGEIFAGIKPVPTGTTVFKSVGLAIEDVAAARLVFERATQPRD